MAGVVVKVVAAVAGIEQGKILFPILYASIDPIKSRHRGMLKAAIQKVLFVIATKKSHPKLRVGFLFTSCLKTHFDPSPGPFSSREGET